MGGFEPAFFAYMEETDFCWRAQTANCKIWYYGGSAVEHAGGGTLPKANLHKTYLNFRNGLVLLFKNTAPGELAGFPSYACYSTRWLARERPGTYRVSVVWAYFGQVKKRFAELKLT